MANGILLFLFCLFTSQQLFGQNENPQNLPRKILEAGYPFIQNYTPDDYEAFDQNWSITQDSLGILYFANTDGVLSYNGVHWNLLELPNKGRVFSLDSDANGKIYVGSQDEIGYLQADSIGRLEYVSLLPFLDKEYQDFNFIRRIHGTNEGAYFQGDRLIFRWNGEKFKVWKIEEKVFFNTFHINNTLYLHQVGKGLMKLAMDEFEMIPAGDMLIDGGFFFMLPFNGNQLLIGTRKMVYTHDGISFTPITNAEAGFFQDNILYCAAALPNGTYAIGSLKKGILIIDGEGHQLTQLSGNSLLQSDGVHALFQDRSGLLWAALNSGIAKIEYPSPFSVYNEASGLSKLASKILRYQDKIYVGTYSGLFSIEIDSVQTPKAIPYAALSQPIFAMGVFNNNLLAASYDLFNISSPGAPHMIIKGQALSLEQSKLDGNRVFVGLSPGLSSLYYEAGEWLVEKEFQNVTQSIYGIVEDANGDLWLRTEANFTVRITFGNKNNSQKLINPEVKIYDAEDGFPDDDTTPFLINGEVHYVTPDGAVYLYNKKTDRFNNDRVLFNTLDIEHRQLKINHVDDLGNIWFTTNDNGNKFDQMVAWKMRGGTYQIESLNESRIINLKRETPYVELTDSVVWYKALSGGIIRHNLREKPLYSKMYHAALIQKVLYQGDSLLFAGHGISKTSEVAYEQNQFRFEYASPSFYQEEHNQFQVYLEGFDENWSNWTLESQKDYTNIPEGNYVFKVRARNIFGGISQVDRYSFTVFPPWHRAWWAYLLYLATGIAVVYFLIRLRSRQLYHKNLALEATVIDRTAEITKKNSQLESQTHQLQEQTEQLKVVDKMKTRLFANISHEFRTPLTLIKGPIEKLEETHQNEISTTNIKMIRRNANRLLKLVNQLLDLSKLDAGSLKLEASEGNVYKCLRAAASSFSSHAAQRDMDYDIKIPTETLWASFDRDKLEKIVYNLLSNAFKFSPDNATVGFSSRFVHGNLEIKVTDTGYGIPSDRLPHIFDRFFQVDDSFTKEKEGTGIGLALTKELVDLMGGTIHLETEYQKGSIFKIAIPIDEIKTSQEELDELPDQALSKEGVTVGSISPSLPKSETVATILIIEDHPDMRDFIRQQLFEDYRVLEAVNGKVGMDKALTKVPDLIITDLMMPQMDGITLCKKLKRNINTSHIPLIMLTAKAGLENKLEGLETGADAYLTKPFNAKELQVVTKNLIEQRQNLRKLFSKSHGIDPKDVTVNSLDEKFLKQAMQLLEQRFSDPQFGIMDMQKSLAMSRAQLHRKIKAITDEAPGELLRNFRLKRAAQILEQKGENVTQVAYMVGFNNLSYFAKCFKEYFGVAPSKYPPK